MACNDQSLRARPMRGASDLRKFGEAAVKVAFVGKGGSGKTTLSSLFVRQLAAAGAPVTAIDADVNQHLAVALGLPEDEAAAIPAMGEHLLKIKEYLRGDNPRIASAEQMVKTTPPGRGSRLLRVGGDELVQTGLAVDVARPGAAGLGPPRAGRRACRAGGAADGDRSVRRGRPGGGLLPRQDRRGRA